MRTLLAGSLIACLAFGCGGDDDGPSTDARPPDAPPAPDAGPDASPPDASPPDAQPGTGIGEQCPAGNECATGLSCLDETVDPTLPPNGYCTTPCLSDMDCGWDSFCSPPLGGGVRLCFQKCMTDAAGCAGAPERVCGNLLGGLVDVGQLGCFPGNPFGFDGDACDSFSDCNRNSGCILNEFELPGGYCVTVGCTIGDDSTCAPGGDGVCVPSDGVNICVDSCSSPTQCRTVEGYDCLPVPTGDPFSVCIMAHLDTGDPCAAPAECGAGAWTCLTGAGFPGGYCSGAVGACDATIPETCPGDAVCYDPTPAMTGNGDQYCAAMCDPMVSPSACREAEGYTCDMIGPGAGACAGP